MKLAQILQSLVDKLIGWVEQAVLLLPNFVAAVLVVVVFWLIAKLARQIVRKALDRVSANRHVNKLLATISYVALLTVGVFVALSVLKLEGAVTSLLAGVGIIGLAIGFAFQDITANFISGILLSIRRPFKEGDLIETNNHFGTVRDINMRATLVRTTTGQIVTIPNKDVFQNPIINYSTTGKRRIDLECGVAYGDDLEKTRRVAMAAIEGVEARDESRDVEMFFEEFGGSSINFVVRFWIDFGRSNAAYLAAQSEAIIRLKRAFEEENLTMPFPVRTLDFGVVGGVNLDEVLPPALYEHNGKERSTEPAGSTSSGA